LLNAVELEGIILNGFTMPANCAEFNHLLSKSRDAKKHGQDAWACQSTGEKLAVALVLNRPDWLASMRYTIGEALDRVGDEWVTIIPLVERTLRQEGD
jgi:hypothetical protein